MISGYKRANITVFPTCWRRVTPAFPQQSSSDSDGLWFNNFY